MIFLFRSLHHFSSGPHRIHSSFVYLAFEKVTSARHTCKSPSFQTFHFLYSYLHPYNFRSSLFQYCSSNQEDSHTLFSLHLPILWPGAYLQTQEHRQTWRFFKFLLPQWSEDSAHYAEVPENSYLMFFPLIQSCLYLIDRSYIFSSTRQGARKIKPLYFLIAAIISCRMCWCTSVIPEHGTLMQEDHCEFRISLGYKVDSEPVWTAWWTLPQKNKKVITSCALVDKICPVISL